MNHVNPIVEVHMYKHTQAAFVGKAILHKACLCLKTELIPSIAED